MLSGGMDLEWLLFRQLDTSYSHLGGGRLNLEDASRRLGAKQTSLRGISLISDPQGKKAQPIVGGAAPVLVLLVLEEDWLSKPCG